MLERAGKNHRVFIAKRCFQVNYILKVKIFGFLTV